MHFLQIAKFAHRDASTYISLTAVGRISYQWITTALNATRESRGDQKVVSVRLAGCRERESEREREGWERCRASGRLGPLSHRPGRAASDSYVGAFKCFDWISCRCRLFYFPVPRIRILCLSNASWLPVSLCDTIGARGHVSRPLFIQNICRSVPLLRAALIPGAARSCDPWASNGDILASIMWTTVWGKSGVVVDSAGTHPVEFGFLWRHSESNHDSSPIGNVTKSRSFYLHRRSNVNAASYPHGDTCAATFILEPTIGRLNYCLRGPSDGASESFEIYNRSGGG